MSSPQDRKGQHREAPAQARDLAHELELMATDEQQILAEALGLEDAPGLDRVDEVLQQAWRETAASGVRWKALPWRLPLAVAAAGMLLFGVSHLSSSTRSALEQAPAGSTLSLNGFGFVPVSSSESMRSGLKWVGPDDARYRLEIRRLEDDAELWNQELTVDHFDLESLSAEAAGQEVVVMLHLLGETSDDLLDTQVLMLRIPSGM